MYSNKSFKPQVTFYKTLTHLRKKACIIFMWDVTIKELYGIKIYNFLKKIKFY